MNTSFAQWLSIAVWSLVAATQGGRCVAFSRVAFGRRHRGSIPTRLRNRLTYYTYTTWAPTPENNVQSTLLQSTFGSSEDTSVAVGSTDDSNGDIGQINTTVTLPISIPELLNLPAGDCVTSETIRLQRDGETFEFCIQLYPRGSAASWKNRNQGGFGMAAAVVVPNFSQRDETVDIFVQFRPQHVDQCVDASFALRLLGRQAPPQRRFDVAWQSGMRFVDETRCQLGQGRAPDFGARLMQTQLLPNFLGYSGTVSSDSVQIQVSMQLHADTARPNTRTDDTSRSFFSFRDVRRLSDNTDMQQPHDTEHVRVGRIVVPVLTRIAQRPQMLAQGAYPGVEYRIMRIHTNGNNEQDTTDLFYSRPGAYYDLKPIYPLVAQLERTWPVTVCETDIPKLVTPTQYNTISAVGSLATAVTGLLAAFTISQAVSFYYIPSRSMDPTLSVGDVLLVEKLSPRWQSLMRGMGLESNGGGYRVNDIVLFSPPEQLLDVVAQSGGRIPSRRDLFVKRVAARPGDVVTVDRTLGTVTVNGADVSTRRRDLCDAEPLGLIRRYLAQGVTQPEAVVPTGTVQVLGDCGSVSIDSRVWGPLPVQNVVGRPLVRLWPLSKFGPVPSLPPLTMNWKATDEL